MSELISERLLEYIQSFGISYDLAIYVKLIVLLATIVLLGFVLNFIGKRIILRLISNISRITKSNWDDILVEKRVFERLSNVLPAIAFIAFNDLIFADFPNWAPITRSGIDVFIIFVFVSVVYSFLNAVRDIMENSSQFKDKPVNSYVQLGKIIAGIIAGILVLSILLGQSPLTVLTAMGALTAIIILIFRDTILGFVASIQMAANDMIRVGDWVTVEKYGADGDVMEISLNTVKVRNFDKTISTIPTYAFITDGVKNWRGMSESEGRRIKRAIHINISSVHFADEALLTHLSKIQLLKEYIRTRQAEIERSNTEREVDQSVLVNGRRMTNLGLFRRYIEEYLKQHPMINTKLTCMVRQLAPGPDGLPLEVYAFSADKDWVNYEGIMADIFDHILASASHFDLVIFEHQSGYDLRQFAQNSLPAGKG
jgi:miniconductance mechanosensitive channel